MKKMAITSKNVFLVLCDRDIFERIFFKKKNSDIINRYDIHQKLTNNDISKTPPTEEIVNYQISKRLNSFRDCRRTEFIFFLNDKINVEFINNLKKFLKNSHVPIFYHLLLDQEIEDFEIIKEFNTVQYLENDKVANIR